MTAIQLSQISAELPPVKAVKRQQFSINGVKLDQVQIWTPPGDKRGNNEHYLVFPRCRIVFTVEIQKILLSIPSVLALELYRRCVLPQIPMKTFPVSIGRKKMGLYRISAFRYSDCGGLFSIDLFKEANG